MSDRWVFLTAFGTAILVFAGAFAIPQYFWFELLKTALYVTVAILVFFGEDKYSYMLGIVGPPVWFVVNILLGGFFGEFVTLWETITMKSTSKTDTPLHGLAILTEIALVVLSVRVWRKQVTEKLFGKTFGICLAISIVYGAILAGYFVFGTAPSGRLP